MFALSFPFYPRLGAAATSKVQQVGLTKGKHTHKGINTSLMLAINLIKVKKKSGVDKPQLRARH